MSDNQIIDSRGSFCPGPLTDLFKAYRSAAVGDVLELWATDPAARPDVTAWCAKSGNTLVEAVEDGDHLRLVVRIDRKG